MSEPVKVVIEVSGGVVTAVFAGSFVEVIVVDHDNIEQGDPPASELCFSDGMSAEKFMGMSEVVY